MKGGVRGGAEHVLRGVSSKRAFCLVQEFLGASLQLFKCGKIILVVD